MGFSARLPSLPADYQKLVAETLLLRVCYGLENSFKTISSKIICNAKYLDGTKPNLLVASRSADGAIQNMMAYGRPKPRSLRWTKVAEIKENVRHLIHPSDHFIKVLDHHGTLVADMRKVRNRIAHNNASSRRDFMIVVRKHYGAELNSVTPGILLLSDRRAPNLLEQYLTLSRALIKQLVKI